MDIINNSLYTFTKSVFDNDKIYFLSPFVLKKTDGNSTVLFNSLNGMCCGFKNSNFNNELQYLVENLFYISDDTDIYSIAKEFRNNIYNIDEFTCIDTISDVVITTTTTCNANCQYCFERDIVKHSSINKTQALKISKFLIEHYNNNNLNITWFGGEPLLNCDAIKIICDDLHKNNINFTSSIISNGSLFNQEIVDYLKTKANLKVAQITLDGYGEDNDKIKNYKSNITFSNIIQNIVLLLNNQINVSIRLNLSENTFDSCKKIIEFLNVFLNSKQKQFVNIYIHELFDVLESSEESQNLVFSNIEYLNTEICKYFPISDNVTHLFSYNKLSCSANNDYSYMLTPNGFITKCESVIHDFTNNEIVGHISDLNNLDAEKINSWKEYKYDPNDELCKTCFYMTKCNRLKKCPDLSKCTPRYIKYLRNKLMFELNSVFANYIKKYNHK